MLYLKCSGQVVSIDKDERFADKYINANTVHWEFCERWNGMTITAQFTQEGKTYNVVVDDVTGTTTVPNEIVAGEVDISAFGVHPETGVRITTIPVKKKIDKSGFVGDGETQIPPTPDLYAQLIAKIDEVGEIPVEEIENAVNAYMDANPIQTGATPEQAAQIEANKRAIEEYTPPVTSVNGMTGDVVIEAGGGDVDSIAWDKVVGKPSAYPPEEHDHTWNDLKEKPSEFTPSEHTHSYADLEDKPTIPIVPNVLPNPFPIVINGQEYNGSQRVDVNIDDDIAWNDVTGKPSTYPPANHSHAWGEVTGKPSAFPPESHTHAAEDIGAKPADYVPTWEEVTGKPDALTSAAVEEWTFTLEDGSTVTKKVLIVD